MLNFKPWVYGVFYFCNIVVFSLIYYFCFNNSFKNLESLDYIEAFYFSVVSITTLGYGDIIPTLTNTKLLVVIIFQVILGIITIGLFLNSLSQKLSDIKDKKIEKEEQIKNDELVKKQLLILKPFIEDHLKMLAQIYSATAIESKENRSVYPKDLFTQSYYDRISIIDCFQKKVIDVKGNKKDVYWCEYIDSEFKFFKSNLENFLLKFSVLLPIELIELITEIQNEFFLNIFEDEIAMLNRYNNSGISNYPPSGLSLEHSKNDYELPENEKIIKNYHNRLLKLIEIIDKKTNNRISMYVREDSNKCTYFGVARGRVGL